MKKIIILILFSTYNSMLFSQEKDSLIVGEWNVIYVQTHNYEYNALTDSLTYTKAFAKLTPKLIKDFNYKNIEDLRNQSKKDLSNDQFIFDNKKSYYRKKRGEILRKGNYYVNKSKNRIYFKDNDRSEYSMKYSMKKGLLYLKIKFKGPISIKPTKFTLKKT